MAYAYSRTTASAKNGHISEENAKKANAKGNAMPSGQEAKDGMTATANYCSMRIAQISKANINVYLPDLLL